MDACVSVCAFVTQVCLCVEVSLGVCVGLCLSIELSMYQSTCLSLHGLRDVFVLSEFPPQLSQCVCVFVCLSLSQLLGVSLCEHLCMPCWVCVPL